MDKAIKVLMIDDNIKLIKRSKEHFNINKKIDIVFEANDGKEGLMLILDKKNEYDIIIMDLLLSNKDGISILETIRNHKINKKIIIISSYIDDDVIKKACQYDINYFINKPFDFYDLEKKIIEVFKSPNYEKFITSSEIEKSISKLLHLFGIPSSIRGYHYLIDGIYLVYTNSNYIKHVTKLLYPKIAIQNMATPSRVERAIRNAIEIGWNRGDYKLMEEVFGNSIDINKAKPTNSEFIATLALELKLNR